EDSFFVADDDIVVVDRSHKVVDVVPVGPRSRFAHAGPSGGGVAAGGGGSPGGLDLSREGIIEGRTVLIEQGFLTGQPTGVIDVRTRDAITSFQRQKGIQVTGSIDTRTVSSLGLSGKVKGGGTTGQGSAGTQQPAQNNNMSGQNPPTNGQASPQ